MGDARTSATSSVVDRLWGGGAEGMHSVSGQGFLSESRESFLRREADERDRGGMDGLAAIKWSMA